MAEGQRSLGDLVRAAEQHDASAWDELVARHTGLLLSITRDYRMSPSDASDAVQSAWLRLLEHLGKLDNPDSVTAWLATTTRRECLRIIALRRRTVLAGEDADLLERSEVAPDPVSRLTAEEDAVAVREALGMLPQRWRQLMELLMSDPPTSYEEISRTLPIPIGSIGPTRKRCLQRLRLMVETESLP
ncbi:MAG TPA: sigma-70 family RNA polymerase sigma factor [Mycobacteriales bacterium]|nr:sigma-70 family RNA polymerase sigma factor [Mycobacteriales bacterium]